MTEPSVDYQLGSLSARIALNEQRQAALEQSIDRRLTLIETRVGAVHDVITSGRGGWRMLAALGALVAGLSTVTFAVLHWVWPR